VADLDRLLGDAETTPTDGWDLGRLGDRISIRPPAWNFERIVEEHARRASDLLDLGTGGGEWLASLRYRPPRTVATEAWPPNVDVAGRRLRPLGITVVRAGGAPDNAEQEPGETRGRLPFPGSSFELISSRHESFVAAEIARVLVPGGVFLTQQTGGDYGELYDALELPRPGRPRRSWDLDLAREQLGAAGLRVVDSAAGSEATTFADVGALAWYLRAIPWVVDGFAPDRHRSSLERLQQRIDADGPITISQPSFWLKAEKPG
jgi:SAM-dependent methyltransferase